MWEIEFKKMYEDGGKYLVFDVDQFSIDVISAASDLLSNGGSISENNLAKITNAEWDEDYEDDVVAAVGDYLIGMDWDRLEGVCIDALDNYLGAEDSADEFLEVITHPATIRELARVHQIDGIENEGIILVRYADDGDVVLDVYVFAFNYGYASAIEIQGELKFELVYENPEV